MGRLNRSARPACGFVDNASALPTTPQAQQLQQKRSIDVLPKPDNLMCSLHRAEAACMESQPASYLDIAFSPATPAKR